MSSESCSLKCSEAALWRQWWAQVRPEFVAQMEAELKANDSKGDWAQWKPSSFEALSELRHHLLKLEVALQRREGEAVEEYSADCANILMKIHECGSMSQLRKAEKSWTRVESLLLQTSGSSSRAAG
jgi:hypothetical protein